MDRAPVDAGAVERTSTKEPGTMLTQEEDAEAHALGKRGWSYSAFARHIGRDRRTVKAYLEGDRVPGQRRRAAPTHSRPAAPSSRCALLTTRTCGRRRCMT